jgi:hypothetical protein
MLARWRTDRDTARLQRGHEPSPAATGRSSPPTEPRPLACEAAASRRPAPAQPIGALCSRCTEAPPAGRHQDQDQVPGAWRRGRGPGRRRATVRTGVDSRPAVSASPAEACRYLLSLRASSGPRDGAERIRDATSSFLFVRSPLASTRDTRASSRSLIGSGNDSPTLPSGQSRSGVAALIRLRLLTSRGSSRARDSSIITCLTYFYRVANVLELKRAALMGRVR